MGREAGNLRSRWLVEGTCWACHRPNRDHTIAELSACADRPLALEIVETEEGTPEAS
jgi:hypothetical protein